MSIQVPVGGHIDVNPMAFAPGAQARVVASARFAVGDSRWQQPVRAPHPGDGYEPTAEPQTADRSVRLVHCRCCTGTGKLRQ